MSADLDQALQVRERSRARRRHRRLLLAAAGLLAALVAAALVCFSPILVVRDVEVTGTSLTSADDVRAAASVPMGTPLARLDAGAITGRVEQLATVADVRLVRDWPHTVRIEVTERAAVYQFSQDGGWGQVDQTGAVYTTSTDRTAVPAATLGDAGDEGLRADVATAAGALPQDVRERLESVEASTMDSITFHLTDGPTVFWGSAEQSSEKAPVLEVLLAQSGDHTRYDVSAPSRPAVS